jgi:thiamine pyrophosphate-dependent acetolactate synthase large subunit-like protein
VQTLLSDTDLVIAVGTQLSLTDLWETPPSLGRRFAQINIDPADLNRNYRADIAVAASATAALEALLPRVAEAEAADRTAEQRVADTIAAATAELPRVLGIDAARFARMHRIFAALRAALPQDGVLVTDMTSPAYVGLSEYPARAPRTFMHPVGYGTLGFALPAAVGISVAEPGTPVCVLAGDGGFQFTMQELGVAAQEELSLPIVIFNDGGYGEIRRTEDARHPGTRIGVDLRTPDFVKLAATYGIEGCRVAEPEELEREVRAALGRRGPTIIEMEDR